MVCRPERQLRIAEEQLGKERAAVVRRLHGELAQTRPEYRLVLLEIAGVSLLALVEPRQRIVDLLEGALGGSLIEGSEELPVRGRLKDEARSTVDAVLGLDLVNASLTRQGRYGGVPLTALGNVQVVPAEATIYRRNGERINTVQGFVERNVLPEVALAQVQERIASSGLILPPGYDGPVPEGYFVARSKTYGVWLALRARLDADRQPDTRLAATNIATPLRPLRSRSITRAGCGIHRLIFEEFLL